MERRSSIASSIFSKSLTFSSCAVDFVHNSSTAELLHNDAFMYTRRITNYWTLCIAIHKVELPAENQASIGVIQST